MPDGKEGLRVTAQGRAVFARLRDGDGVIVDTETAFYFGLNKTAAFLWQRLQESSGVTVAELASALCATFAVERAQAERDVSEFVEKILQNALATRVNGEPAGGDSFEAGRST